MLRTIGMVIILVLGVSSFADQSSKVESKKVSKSECIQKAKQKVSKKFHVKAEVGNTNVDPWAFAIEQDGCTYVVSIWNEGKNGACVLSEPQKDVSPSTCEGE